MDRRSSPTNALRCEDTTSTPAECPDISTDSENCLVGHDGRGCTLTREMGMPLRVPGLWVEFVKVSCSDIDITVGSRCSGGKAVKISPPSNLT